METFPYIPATEWLLAISISTSLPPLCQDWTWVLSAPQDLVMMSLKMVTRHQNSAYIYHQDNYVML